MLVDNASIAEEAEALIAVHAPSLPPTSTSKLVPSAHIDHDEKPPLPLNSMVVNLTTSHPMPLEVSQDQMAPLE